MYCIVLEFNVKKAPLKCARKSAGAASWAGKKLWKSPSRLLAWHCDVPLYKKSHVLFAGRVVCMEISGWVTADQRKIFSRDQKRQKSTMQLECFQQFQTFPISIHKSQG